MIIIMLENVGHSVLQVPRSLSLNLPHCYIAYFLPKSKCISYFNMVMLKFHSIYQRFLLWVKKIALHKSDSHIFSKNINFNVVIGYKETT